MDYNIQVSSRKDDLINIVTNETKVHPEISMISSSEHIAEDINIITRLQHEIINNNLRVHDHYLLFHESRKSIFGFIITEPGREDRLRLVIINRPYYDKEIKDYY